MYSLTLEAPTLAELADLTEASLAEQRVALGKSAPARAQRPATRAHGFTLDDFKKERTPDQQRVIDCCIAHGGIGKWKQFEELTGRHGRSLNAVISTMQRAAERAFGVPLFICGDHEWIARKPVPVWDREFRLNPVIWPGADELPANVTAIS